VLWVVFYFRAVLARVRHASVAPAAAGRCALFFHTVVEPTDHKESGHSDNDNNNHGLHGLPPLKAQARDNFTTLLVFAPVCGT
jgi:hypothetical protein